MKYELTELFWGSSSSNVCEGAKKIQYHFHWNAETLVTNHFQCHSWVEEHQRLSSTLTNSNESLDLKKLNVEIEVQVQGMTYMSNQSVCSSAIAIRSKIAK